MAAARSPAVGNLRQRALAAAHRMLETRGEAGLTLRAIAAELSSGAGGLYHHFANKDALLAELAVDGFAELGRWMATAAAAPAPGRTPFNACAHAYLGFTRHRPALYAIMYNERLLASHAGVRRAEAEAFEVFRRSLDRGCVVEAKADDVALAFWALGRGVAAISCRADSDRPGAARDIVVRAMRGLEALAGHPLALIGPIADDAA
ncbi:MAG TPA: TetR/AcrR family transcriptional regulator [Caulobacteraceae bacterium]|jgi:AcrR family transcriptional regulator